jgi:D-methionine transport system substrate-binding protein
MSHAKFFLINLLFSSLLIVSACSQKERGENEIYVGTITGPETTLMETAKKIAQERYGLKIKIISYEDYVMPNTALVEGDIDANMFQHQPYLDVVLAKQKYDIISIGKMFVYPMAIYSKKYKHITDLPKGAVIGIPNDPSNAARALRLLAHANLIKIPNVNDFDLTPKEILENPHQLVIKEIAAPQLPRVLIDLDAAAINTNYAIPGGLMPNKEAIFIESKDSPYANIVVIRSKDKDKDKFQRLMSALHSPEVIAQAKQLFHDQAISAW